MMDPIQPQGSGLPSVGASLVGVPFKEKWNHLRPVIEHLYIAENMKLSDVVMLMKIRHGFDAAEHQYKNQFRKWDLKKNIPSSINASISKSIQKRAKLGKTTSKVFYKGYEVDKNKLRRRIKTDARREIFLKATADEEVANTLAGHSLHFANKIFMTWNMPYGALRSWTSGRFNNLSPFGPVASTPSDVMMPSPASANSAPSPTNAPSPLSMALKGKTMNDRARLFVEGRHDELLRSMEKEERKIMSTWLYQFWLFSYKTAKHWGRGPRDWTAGLLQFGAFQDTVTGSTPNTPGIGTGTPIAYFSPNNTFMDESSSTQSWPRPSPLCRWSIHVVEESYLHVPSPPSSPTVVFNVNNEESWKSWPSSWQSTTFQEKLQNGLESNDFSTLKVNDLPIAVNQIVRAAKRSPDELFEEAFGFSIMSCNEELLRMLLVQVGQRHNVANGYPFHLATSYLCGSKSCCNIFDSLAQNLCGENSIRKIYLNKLEHTVLDNLMIVILKSHTSCLPSMVDDALKKEKRFAGEEVDICGRWDADSECVRVLLANGISTIPFAWKHMFCHTSVQTICHCISSLDRHVDISTPSGLFLKHCRHCGLKMQLLPLHTMVLTAIHLAWRGCTGENLFGILACLLALLATGADPKRKAPISLGALLGEEHGDDCTHRELDPLELADEVPDKMLSMWSSEAIIGWRIIRIVLRESQRKWRPELHQIEDDSGDDIEDDSGDDSDCGSDCEFCFDCFDADINIFGKSQILATLRAAVQTELLTYRRLEQGDAWISEYFKMEDLLESLEAGHGVSIGLVNKGMMKPYCRSCGRFLDQGAKLHAVVEDACSHYFCNMEDWSRSTFVHQEEY